MLVKRWLDSRDAQPMSGTEGTTCLSFSPDSKRIAFVSLDHPNISSTPPTGGTLKIVSVDGGPATTLCDNVLWPWIHWGEDDFIYFTSNTDNGLHRILATDVTRTSESLTLPGEDE